MHGEGSSRGLQRRGETGSYNVAHGACFRGSAREDEGYVLAAFVVRHVVVAAGADAGAESAG